MSAAVPADHAADREAGVLGLADGRKVGYADYGARDGQPVLALHGTPGSRLMYRLADGPARERGLRLVAPDRPGCGQSSMRQAHGFSAWSSDLAAIADALGIGRFAAIGVSGGGPYAAACAARLAPRVRALALVSPVGPPQPRNALSLPHRVIFRGLASSDWLSLATFRAIRFALDHAPDLAYQGLVSRSAAADKPILLKPQVKASLLAAMGEGLRPGIAGAAQDLRLFATGWDTDLAAVAAPAGLWQGSDDRTVPPAAAYALAARIPGCELVRLAGAGHYWVFDHFADVLDWVAARCVEKTP